jgi:hypothetical protein
MALDAFGQIEFAGPDAVLGSLAKVLPEGSPLLKSVASEVAKITAATNAERPALLVKFAKMFKTLEDPQFAKFADQFLVKSVKQYHAVAEAEEETRQVFLVFNRAFERVGDAALTRELLQSVPTAIDDGKAARRLMQFLGNPDVLELELFNALKEGGKLKFLAEGVGKGGWSNDAAKAYVLAVKNGNAAASKLEELAHIKGSGKWASELGEVGIEFEMDTTKALLNQEVNVLEVRRSIINSAGKQVTDFDIVTPDKIYEVKARNWALLKEQGLLTGELAKLKAQLQAIKENAPVGKVLIFKSKYALEPEIQKVLDSVGGFILE